MLSYRCTLHVVLQVQRCARMDEVWVPTHFHKAVFEKRCVRSVPKRCTEGHCPCRYSTNMHRKCNVHGMRLTPVAQRPAL